LIGEMREMKNGEHKTKGLFFRITVHHGERKISCERKFKDFEYLRQGLSRAFPGCFVPRIIVNELT